MKMLIFGLVALACVLVIVGCSLFQQRVVAVDGEGYLLKSDGTRALDESGKPIKAPEGSLTSVGALLAIGGTVAAMRLGGGFLSKLPPPWGFLATLVLGGTGLGHPKEPPKT